MVYIKNSFNSFYVTDLHVLGRSVIERAGITETVQCYLKIEFSGACYKYKPVESLIVVNYSSISVPVCYENTSIQ